MPCDLDKGHVGQVMPEVVRDVITNYDRRIADFTGG
jgi:hypothetical protein